MVYWITMGVGTVNQDTWTVFHLREGSRVYFVPIWVLGARTPGFASISGKAVGYGEGGEGVREGGVGRKDSWVVSPLWDDCETSEVTVGGLKSQDTWVFSHI